MAKLLVAEDDEFSRDMLVRRLQRRGFEVITACDGREAVMAARQHRPDAILMDLDMPVMDGHAAMRAIRSDPKAFRIPIIVLTANASAECVLEAKSNGCTSYETKPVVLQRLVERIEAILAASTSTKPDPNAPAALAGPAPAP
jgi:CheY-like chemotaxis protein